MSTILKFLRQSIGLQPISNKIAKDRLNIMIKQQRICKNNEKLLYDVTNVVTQYLKIQADKNPYISCISFLFSSFFRHFILILILIIFLDDNDEMILHFPIVMEQSRI